MDVVIKFDPRSDRFQLSVDGAKNSNYSQWLWLYKVTKLTLQNNWETMNRTREAISTFKFRVSWEISLISKIYMYLMKGGQTIMGGWVEYVESYSSPTFSLEGVWFPWSIWAVYKQHACFSQVLVSQQTHGSKLTQSSQPSDSMLKKILLLKTKEENKTNRKSVNCGCHPSLAHVLSEAEKWKVLVTQSSPTLRPYGL